MADFERVENVTVDDIGDFSYTNTHHKPGSPESDTARVNVQFELSNGEVATRDYNLINVLQQDAQGQAYLATLLEMRDYLRVRMVGELLPTVAP